jgi:hypothetical protein
MALEKLTTVSRFSMVIGMMGKSDKDMISELFNALGSKGCKELEKLKTMYRC